eukprot:1158195-Pelagomonas_calceolata.AAC.1
MPFFSEVTKVAIGYDLQPGSLAAQPAGLYQPHGNIHDLKNKAINLINLFLQEMKHILRWLKYSEKCLTRPGHFKLCEWRGSREQMCNPS